jgi:hypothetical protein
MNDFTQYPEALELKQLGFDEPCLGYYFYNALFKEWNLNIDNKSDEYTITIQAPTYSQAFRWFREEHKLIAGIFPNNHSLQDNVSYIGYVGKFKKGNVEVYETYEEAELGCLRAMIKLVKEHGQK